MRPFRSRIFRASAAVAIGSLASVGLSGLAFAAPVTTPTLTAPTNGASVTGDVTLTATSTAATVQFLVDGVELGTPVGVSGGSATTSWPTDGVVNGGHTIAAEDCDTDCGTPSASVSVTVANVAPSLTSPTASETVGSATTLSATATEGGVKFFVDSVAVGFDGTAPFTQPVTGLSEGAHTASVQACNTAGTACAGPASSATSFTVQVLHPTITGLAPTGVSPNGDGRDDATKLSFSLPDSESTSYSVVTTLGAVVRGPVSLGVLGAGAHSVIWNGLDNSGHRPADGVYTIQLNTYRHLTGSELATGQATRGVRIDDTAPSLASASGNGTTFYPYPDTYGDTFSPHITVGETATVYLDILSTKGSLIRRIGVYHSGPGVATVTWNGRLTNNSIAPAGTYRFRMWAEDTAGNRTVTGLYTVYVSAKRLVSKVATLEVNGNSGHYFTTGLGCTGVSNQESTFVNGAWLTNSCTDPAVIYGEYSIAVPGATRYNSIDLKTYGNTVSAPEHIFGAWLNYTPDTFTVGGYRLLQHNETNAWVDLGTVSATGRVSGKHVDVAVVLPNIDGQEDFDIGIVAVTVKYQVLQ
jgi:flagellar hook assembly protein FlgD